MKHIILIFASCIIALFVFSNVNADQQIILKIEGMTCKLGPLAINKSLSATEGVKEVEVSYEQGKAWMTVSEPIKNQILKVGGSRYLLPG